jgi:MFS family permease
MPNKTETELPRGVFQNFLWEVAFSSAHVSLVSGVFFTGFLLLLGASNVTIGIVASVPFMVNVAAPFFPYLIGRARSARYVCLAAALATKILWFAVPVIALAALYRWISLPLVFFTIAFGVLSLVGNFSATGWSTWMADLVPEQRRGYYFGRRTIIGGIVGALVSFGGGKYLDAWKDSPYIGFATLFGAACVIGLVNYLFLAKLPESAPLAATRPADHDLFGGIRRALADRAFTKLLAFNGTWALILSVMGVYLQVYMIKELKLSYTMITFFAMFHMVIYLSLTDFWGKLIDRHGCKPVLLICGHMVSITPFLWILTGCSVWLILPLYVIGAATWSGLNLSQFNITLKMTPAADRSSYLAANTFLTSAGTIGGQVLGGLLVDALTGMHFTFLGLVWGPYQILFLVCGIIRFIPMRFLYRIEERQSEPAEKVFGVVRGSIGTGFVDGVGVLLDYLLLPMKKTVDLVGDIIHEVTDEEGPKS